MRDGDAQLECYGYKVMKRGNKHNRRFLLRSDAGKDTEGHLERRNDQRPSRLQEEEWEWERGETHTRLDLVHGYIVPMGPITFPRSEF